MTPEQRLAWNHLLHEVLIRLPDALELFDIGLAVYAAADLYKNKLFNYDNGMNWTWALFSSLTLVMEWFPITRFTQPMKPWIRYSAL